MNNLVKINLKSKKISYNNNVATKDKEQIKMKKNETSYLTEVTEEWKDYLHWCVSENKVPTLYKNFREFMNTHFKEVAKDVKEKK